MPEHCGSHLQSQLLEGWVMVSMSSNPSRARWAAVLIHQQKDGYGAIGWRVAVLKQQQNGCENIKDINNFWRCLEFYTAYFRD